LRLDLRLGLRFLVIGGNSDTSVIVVFLPVSLSMMIVSDRNFSIVAYLSSFFHVSVLVGFFGIVFHLLFAFSEHHVAVG